LSWGRSLEIQIGFGLYLNSKHVSQPFFFLHVINLLRVVDPPKADVDYSSVIFVVFDPLSDTDFVLELCA
jgi:hypothetical protein